MEAGAAAGPAAPAADAAQQQQGAAAPDGEQQQQTPDYGAMQEQLAQIGPSLEEIRAQLSSFGQAPEADAGAPAEAAQAQAQQPSDLSFLDPNSAGYDPQRAGEALLGILGQQTTDAIQQAMQPLQQQLAATQQQLAVQDLVTEFPDLGDADVAQQVIAASRQWVAAAGLPQEAANNPQVWRAVYMMAAAAEAQQQEQQAPTAPAAVEGAGGASPAGGSSSNTADDIIGARGRSVLPFG